MEVVAQAVEAVLASAQAVRGIDTALSVSEVRISCLCVQVDRHCQWRTDLWNSSASVNRSYLSSDNDTAQLRLVLPIAKAPVVSRDALCSPAIAMCSI